MNYLQDCSTFQSVALGVGPDHMKEVNKGWVVLAYKIKLYKPLKLGDEICVGTAPSKFGRVMANRQYFIKDNDGEYAVKALSLIHISEPTRLGMISYAVFCLKKKKKKKIDTVVAPHMTT